MANAFDEFDAPAKSNPFDEFDAKPAPAAAEPGFIPTVKRTGGQMLTSASRSLEDITGPNLVTKGLRDTGQGIIDRNPAGIQSLSDVVESPWLTVKESVGQMVPQLGAAYAGAKAGGLAGGKIAGPRGAAVGSIIGGLAPIFTQEYGGIRDDQVEGKQESIPRALAAATAATALERFGVERLAFPGGLKSIAGQGIKGVLKAAGKGAAVEAPTEALQTGIEQIGAFKDPTTRESLSEAGLAGVMGGIGGGVVGGGIGAVESMMPAPAAPDGVRPTLPVVTPPLQLGAPNPGDAIRAQKLPEVGPLSGAINAGIEDQAQQVDAVAPPIIDPIAQRMADAPAQPTGEVLPGDITRSDGTPFKAMMPAMMAKARAEKKTGMQHDLVPTPAGLVVRAVAAPAAPAAPSNLPPVSVRELSPEEQAGLFTDPNAALDQLTGGATMDPATGQLPVGEVVEDIPVGEADEVLPVGEATEIEQEPASVQPDLARTAAVAAGAGDGVGADAGRGRGAVRHDADVGTGVDRPAAAPVPSGRAAAAMGDRGGAGDSLTDLKAQWTAAVKAGDTAGAAAINDRIVAAKAAIKNAAAPGEATTSAQPSAPAPGAAAPISSTSKATDAKQESPAAAIPEVPEGRQPEGGPVDRRGPAGVDEAPVAAVNAGPAATQGQGAGNEAGDGQGISPGPVATKRTLRDAQAERKAKLTEPAPTVDTSPERVQKAPESVQVATDDDANALPPTLRNASPATRSIYKLDEAIESAKTSRLDREISESTERDDGELSFTPERAMMAMLGHKAAVSELDGKLRSGNRTSATTGTLVTNWREMRRYENTIAESKRANPDLWAQYEARQSAVAALPVGAEVLTPYPSPESPMGSPGKIARKFPKNWRVEYPDGTTVMVPPAALRPAAPKPEAQPTAPVPTTPDAAAPAETAQPTGRVTEAAAPTVPRETERRVDAAKRKRVAAMTPDEMRAALFTDDLTGLHNSRWLAEHENEYSHTIAFDADSLKWVNDNMGHDSGDMLLKAWATALQQATDTASRVGGDEFFALANSAQEAGRITAEVERILREAVITATTPTGEVTITGIGASFGIGTDRKTADEALNQHKRAREAAGQRAGRGEEPPGTTRRLAQEQPDQVDQGRGQDDQAKGLKTPKNLKEAQDRRKAEKADGVLVEATTLAEFVDAIEAGKRVHYDYAGKDGRTLWIEETTSGWVLKDRDDGSTTVGTKGGAGPAGGWPKSTAIRAARETAEFRFTQWKPTPEKAAAPTPSANTIVTEDAAERARALLRRKLGQINSGLDPEVLQAGITLAAYHVERGARKFAAYARAMVDDLGDMVKPYLQSWYMAMRSDPAYGTLRDSMEKASAVEDLDIDEVLATTDAPAAAGPLPEPKWWTDRTPAERVWVLNASRVKGAALTPWNRLAPADQIALNEQWDPKTGLETGPAIADTEDGAPGAENAARKLDRPSQGALARELADDVQPPEGGRGIGRQPAPSGRVDGDGVADADGPGIQLSGGMGTGEGVVPVPARGSGRKPRGPGKRRVQGDGGVQQGLGFAENAWGTGGLIPVNPAPNAEPPAQPAFTPEDFVIEDDLGLGEGGPKAKYQGNVEAIRLLRTLEDDGRLATPSEQRVLAKYIGWGGLAQAFDENNASWSKEHAELKALLSDDEYADAARSTRYAHYTSREIIQDGVYAALRHMGFRGGRTLEAGAGVGNFIGLMPVDMRSESRFTAIEREPFSAAIARHLYPRQIVREADFTEFVGNDDYYDGAVGNPPFASDPQVDASGRKHLSGLSLHNYFFAKAVDMLREGGILAQVITNGFLDAKSDTARRYISDRTTLLGAIRLPNNAFSKNANTEVTTDLIFLQKRPESEWGGKAARLDAKRWLDTGTFEDAEGREVPLNQYFIDHPEMMLGQFGAYGTMYRGESPALIGKPGQDTAAMLREAVLRLPAAVYVDRAITNTAAMADEVIQALRDPTVQEGGYYTRDGVLYQRIKDIAGETRERQVTANTKWTEKTLLGASGVKRITALAEMRATLRALLAAELSSDKGMEALRATLNQQYDAYTKEFGLINDPGTMRVFDDDPDFPLLSSLEHGYTRGMGAAAAKTQGIKPYPSKAAKAPIFSRRVIDARKQVKAVETPADALAVSMAERGKLDSAYIGQLLGRNPDEVLKELSEGDKPLLFMDPADNQYVLRDAYLSGNVREKLVQANQAGLFANVRALEEVQPEDVGAHEINARIGSPWVPESVYESFAKALFGPGTKARISYTKLTAAYTATIEPENGTANTSTWGTPSYHGDSLLVALLNNRPIRVTYKDADGNLQTDRPATEAANIKAQEVRDKFQDWLFTDAERSELLVRAYNDTNNNYVTREFDGSWMTFPGKVPDAIVKFRRHQRNAISRIVQDRTALLDHVVGAGKTYTIVAGAMELKRTGLAKKPLIVVPNHLVKQWAADFYRLYPGANILTATKKDFEKANRRKFLAKIATGDWDAVIMAHSSFGFIKPAPEFESRFNTKQIKNIVDTIKEVEQGDSDKQQKKRTVKQLEGLKERLENRIKSLRDKPMDALLDFEEVGVDQLFVDEAHLFKNLMFSTKMQNIAGLGDSKGSQRAYDMYVKANEVFDKNGRGQGLVFATGTPVSNTLAEMYHMMRYLMPRQMEAMGFESFDAWANTYASVEQVWMQKASGDGFKAQNRMSNFVNTTELLKVFDQVADTVTMDDIKAAFSEENNGAEFPLPKLKGGKRTPVSLRKSAAQNTYMADIASRALALERRRGPPQKGEDNILVIMSDARKAAMDIRLVDATVTEREPGGRIDRSAQEIAARYKQYDSVKGTQLVFSDLGTPLKTVKKELAEYQELLARIEAGQGDQVSTAANLGDEAAIAKVEDAENAANELEEKGRDWVGAMQAAMRGFSVYDDLKAALIEKGIPASEIAFIHDFSTDDQKAALFRKVNAGQVRVLMGSTPKLGAGTNVQERLVALHHLDVPWKPSDVEQREGRIIRQGNQLDGQIPGFEVEVLAYVTQDSLDMRMWQVQETKLKMINQLRTRKVGREVDNAFEDLELSAGEMQAAATGNMDLLREIQLRADIKKLEQRKRAFDAQKSDLQNRMRAADAELASLPAKIEKSRVMAQASTAYKAELTKRTFKATIDGKEYTDAYEAGQYLRGKVDAHVYSKGKGDSKRTITAEQYDALSEEDRRPDVFGTEWKREALPLSVEFNGETYTSRTKLGEAFAEFRGDVTPIAWTYDGTEYKSRKPLAHALRQDAADSLAEQTPKKVGNIGPFAVTIEGQRNSWGEFVEVLLEADGVEISNSVGVASAGSQLGTGADIAEKLAAAIVTAADNMASNAQSQYDYEQHKLKRAIKTKAELDATPIPGEWPDQAKLEKAREAHKKILRSLAAVGAATEGMKREMELTDQWQKQTGAITPPFSRSAASRGLGGGGLPRPDAENVVKALSAGWANPPRIVIADSIDDAAVPQSVRNWDAKQTSGGATDPEGVYIGGTVYLFRNALATPADAARVLMHEALGHFGLRGLYGRDLVAVLDQIAVVRKPEMRELAARYGLDLSNPDHRRQVAEEVLANMAQTNPQIGFVRRAIAAIRTWLREHLSGFNSLRATDDEIVRAYIIPARDFVQRGRAATDATVVPVFSRAYDPLIDIKGRRSIDNERQPNTAAEVRAARAALARIMQADGVTSRDDLRNLLRVPGFSQWAQSPIVGDVDATAALSRDLAERFPGSANGRPALNQEQGFISLSAGWLREAIYRGDTDALKDVAALADKYGVPAAVRGRAGDVAELNDFYAQRLEPAGFQPYTGISENRHNPVSYMRPGGGFGSNTPMFSRAAEILASSATARQLGDRAIDILRSDSTIGVLGRTVGTPYHLAHVKDADGALKNPDLRAVYDEAQDYLNDINTFANDPAGLAPEVVPQLESWRSLLKPLRISEDDRKKLAGAVFEGTLLYTRDGDGNPVEATDDDIPGIVWTPEELRSRYGFNDAHVGMYEQFRAATDRSLDIAVAADVARHLGGKDLPRAIRDMVSKGDVGRFKGLVTALIANKRTAADADLDATRKRHKAELAAFFKKQKAQLDGPEGRAGSRLATLESLDAEKAQIDKDQAKELRGVEAEADKWAKLERDVLGKYARIADLKARGYVPLMRFGMHTLTVRDRETGQVQFFGMYETQAEANVEARRFRQDGTYAQSTVVRGEMSQEEYKLFRGMTPETLELFGDVAGVERSPLMDEYIRRTKANHSALKRLIKRKGTAGYSEDVQRTLAAFLTSNARAASANLHAGEMQRSAQEIAPERGLVKDYAIKLADYVQNPGDEAQAMRGLLFVQYIGGSIASALVNLTQPFTMTIPHLSEHSNPAAAAAAMAGGMRDALRKVDPSSKLGRALAQAEADGTVSPQTLHELQGQAINRIGGTESMLRAMGLGTKAVTAIDTGIRKLLFAWGGFFSLAEQFNRRSTFIAAYHLAEQQKMEDPFTFAKESVAATQGVYNRCVDVETEILTAAGWKSVSELFAGEAVFGIDTDGNLVDDVLQDVHVYPGPQLVTELSTSIGLSVVTTAHHDHLIQSYNSRDKKWQGLRKVNTKDLKQSHHLLRAPLGDATARNQKYSDDEVALFAWVAAEGHLFAHRNVKEKRGVGLVQSQRSNPAYVAEIDALLGRLGGHHNRKTGRGGEMVCWQLRKPLWEKVHKALPGKMLTSTLLSDLTIPQMVLFIDTFTKADGHFPAEGGNTITQKDVGNLNVLQAMAVLTGKTSTVYERVGEHDFGSIYLAKNSVRAHRKAMSAHERTVDTVWCPQTGTGAWIARRNGRTFITGNSNRPQWARGAVGATLFTFKQFSISYVEFFSRLPRREKMLALAALMVSAGAEGLPFAEDLDDLIDTLLQMLGYSQSAKNWRTQVLSDAIGREPAEWILKGATTIPGFPVDMAGRMSLGNLIPGTGILLKDGRDKSGEVLEALGPAGGVVRDALRGEFAPIAMRNLAKGAEMGKTGEYRDSAGRRVADADAMDAAMKGIGFQPQAIARESRDMWTARRLVDQARAVEADIVRKWAQGIADNEPDKVAEAMADLKTWNTDNPERPIRINRVQIGKAARDIRSTREQRYIKTVPKELRAGVVEALN